MIITENTKIFGLSQDSNTYVLIQKLRRMAADKGLTLHRFQTNAPNFHTSIHYGVAPQELDTVIAYCDHPTIKSQSLPEEMPRVFVGGREGQTPRSTAYQRLSELYAEVEAL